MTIADVLDRAMKAALPVTLSLVLIASELPVAAEVQDGTQVAVDARAPEAHTTGSPLLQSVIREELRMVAEERAAPLLTAGLVPSRLPGQSSDWFLVRQLVSGAHIIVTRRGAPPSRGTFVSADGSEVVVSRSRGQVEHIARTEVTQVDVLARPGFRIVNRWSTRGALIGLAAGLITAAVSSRSSCDTSPCDTEGLAFVAFPVVGLGLGAGVGALAGLTRHDVHPLYRVP